MDNADARRSVELENEALRNQVAVARSLILHACDIMTSEQVGQWAGVRSWLEQDWSDYEPFGWCECTYGCDAEHTPEPIKCRAAHK